MIGITENTVASERYNAVDLLRSISSHIRGGGGGRPTLLKAVAHTQKALAFGCRTRTIGARSKQASALPCQSEKQFAGRLRLQETMPFQRFPPFVGSTR